VTELKDCVVGWYGCVSYGEALELQMEVCRLKRLGFEKDVLLLLEHPPTITLGRNGNRNHLLVAEELLKSRGVELWDVDRGGDITFHGPGQLVGYPILSLGPVERDVHGYMRKLEESLIRLLAFYKIDGERVQGLTGVWTRNGKIAAMGVHISRWVTRHGFALNVNTDLSYYDLIVPCGMMGKSVTSMQRRLMRTVDMQEVADRYAVEFGSTFGHRMTKMKVCEFRDELRRLKGVTGAADKSTSPGATGV